MMERACFVLRVKSHRSDEYRARHRAVWPEMLEALRATGWRNYSLFMSQDGLLVGYVECDDFEAARRAMAQRDVNARWQADMADFFELAATGARPDTELVRLEEVFHLD
jgi:L-rhamnose mutarotase